MTSSLASPGFRWFVLGAFAAVWPGAAGLSGALAQETGVQKSVEAPAVGQPMVLTPPSLLSPAPADAAPGDTGARQGEAIDAVVSVEGIEVSRLSAFDPDSVGTLDPGGGGLGHDLWRGSDRRTVERLLPRLPGVLRSAALRDLARRLLLSNAVSPASRRGESSTNLLALRVDRLAALGDYAGLNDLLAIVPQRYDDESIARARVESRLLQGDLATACQEVRYGVGVRQDAGYWRKCLVFCQIVAGEVDQAALGVALLREQGQDDDPTFFLLADQLTGTAAGARPADPVSPLHFAMLRKAGWPLPEKPLEAVDPGLLISLAGAPEGSLVQRTRAAERAVSLGLLPPEALARLYLAFPFEAETLANAISTAPGLSGLERRALLYQAAWGQSLPAARAEILGIALESASAEDVYALAVPIYLPLVAELPLQRELVWFAEAAGRLLYAGGRYERAAAWFTLARQESLLNPRAAGAVARLWPYTRLAAQSSGGWEGNLADWSDAQSGAPSDDLARRRLLLRAVFQALGESDSLAWTELIGTAPAALSEQPAPDAALIYALSEASQFGRLGETVLLALLALGADGPGASHPLVLHEALAALSRVGLESDARRLAIEAAVANGI